LRSTVYLLDSKACMKIILHLNTKLLISLSKLDLHCVSDKLDKF